jgi:hypothetical protein
MRPAVLDIPTFGGDVMLTPLRREGNGIRPNILPTWTTGMIHSIPATLVIGVVGTLGTYSA